jgi:hypothetical protein
VRAVAGDRVDHGIMLSMVAAAAQDADSLDAALVRLVGVLRDDFDLWGIRLVTVAGDHIVVAAGWSAAGSVFEAGTEVAIDLTPTLRRITDAWQAGTLVTYSTADVDLGLITDIQRGEGVASGLLIPLHEVGEVAAALSLTSGSQGVFRDSEAPFFRGIGAAVETRLLELLRRSSD